MRRELCRDSIDVFLHIRSIYPEIERFSFTLYRSGQTGLDSKKCGGEQGDGEVSSPINAHRPAE